jgi:putative restriction endonuclease
MSVLPDRAWPAGQERAMKAVFTHKTGSIYDDLPEERYHFPAAYLRQVEAAVGDLVVYYEPGRTGLGDHARTGRRAYTATAQVSGVERDTRREDHYYALIDPASYVEFDRPVPFRDGALYYERQLRRSDGATSKGAFGRAVRPLSEDEYEAILRAGFARELDELPLGAGASAAATSWAARGLNEADEPLGFERPIVERLLARPVRDAAFRHRVERAYDRTCAMTGLRLINGGGRAEVQAAHIRPVHERGPDSVRNGLALSGTLHWMFDRGLVSIGPPPGYSILIAHRAIPGDASRLLNADRRLRVPADPRFHPAPAYLDWHRQHVFKG